MKTISKNGKEFFVNEHDGFWNKVNNNQWEASTYTIFDKFMDRSHPYLDIGAWIGPTALYGCQIAKHCHAIEPDPVAFKILQDNVRLNPELKDRITLYDCCIGDSCNDAKLGNNNKFGDSSSSILYDHTESITVKSITLDKFIKTNNIKDINFIKMDIEGGELIVLPNIKNYLQNNKPTLFISLHPFLFKDIEKDCRKIVDVLKIYNNISGNEEALSNILLKGKVYNIIATDKEVTKSFADGLARNSDKTVYRDG